MGITLNKTYPVKVWASAVLTGPLIFMFWIMNMTGSAGILAFIVYFVFYGALLSLPTLIICYFAFIYLLKGIRKMLLLKLAFIALSLLCMIASMFQLFRPEHTDVAVNYLTLSFCGSYAIPVVAFGLLFRPAKDDGVEEDFLKDFNTRKH